MLRLSLWFLVGLVGSIYLVWRGAISSAEIFTVLTICLVHSLAVHAEAAETGQGGGVDVDRPVAVGGDHPWVQSARLVGTSLGD